jgi:hypothetical protein
VAGGASPSATDTALLVSSPARFPRFDVTARAQSRFNTMLRVMVSNPGGGMQPRIDYGKASPKGLPFFTDRERAALACTDAVTLVSLDRIPDDVMSMHSRADAGNEGRRPSSEFVVSSRDGEAQEHRSSRGAYGFGIVG